MDLCNDSCSSGWPYVRSSWRGKNFNFGHGTQTLPHFFIPAMLIDIITSTIQSVIPLSLTLTLLEVTRSAQSKTNLLHFLAHFSTDQDEIGYGGSTGD